MRSGVKWFGVALAVGVTGGLSSGAALAQQRTTATFNDWLVQCRMDVPAAAVATDDKKGAPATPAQGTAPAAQKTAAPAPAPAAPAAGQTVKICEMVQTYSFQRTGGQLARLAIGRLPNDTKVKGVIEVPIGVYLPAGTVVKLDDKIEYKGSFLRCTPTTCVAEFDLPADIDNVAKTAKSATLTFTNAARQPVVLRVSVEGFDKAFAAAVQQQGK